MRNIVIPNNNVKVKKKKDTNLLGYQKHLQHQTLRVFHSKFLFLMALLHRSCLLPYVDKILQIISFHAFSLHQLSVVYIMKKKKKKNQRRLLKIAEKRNNPYYSNVGLISDTNN